MARQHLSLTLALFLLAAVSLGGGGVPAEKDSAGPQSKEPTASEQGSQQDPLEQYLSFLDEVHERMEEEYYRDIDEARYETFINSFKTSIYPQLEGENKSSDYVKWRSAAYLVDHLKSEEDIFSAFFPPKPAQEFEKKVLGKRVDLGISGEMIEQGYHVRHVEPRSDAYEEGLRENDLIVRVNEQTLESVGQEEAEKLLNPLEGETTRIFFISALTRELQEIEVETKEYFKQTVFDIPLKLPGIYGLKIEKFNRKTSEDLLLFLEHFRQQGDINGLIMDLRGNPGGPPLAAREISSFFLPEGEDFAYFQKKDRPKALLDVPEIPEKFKYGGPMVILIDENSGSASELFSGVLQHRGRAILMGKNSAGQVLLKSMFHFDDGSMLLLVTARGYHPDGTVFSFDGLMPDRYVTEGQKDDILIYAAKYLYYINENKNL